MRFPLQQAVAFLISCLPIFGQAPKPPSSAEVIAESDKRREAAVLRGLQKFRISPAAQESIGLTEDQERKLVAGILSRYNLSVDSTSTAVKAGVPVITVSMDTNRYQRGSTVIFDVEIHLQLFEPVTPQRDKPVEWPLQIWTDVEGLTFDDVIDKQAVLQAMTTLIERFCLSYLSANR